MRSWEISTGFGAWPDRERRGARYALSKSDLAPLAQTTFPGPVSDNAVDFLDEGHDLVSMSCAFGLRRVRCLRPERSGGIAYGTWSPGLTRPAATPGYSGPVHDEVYKRLFAFPRMVEDLLRGFVRGEWVDDIDFSTLRKLSAEYIGEELRRRHGDTVWRVRRREDGLHLLVLLEFQSTADPDMVLRILEYTALLYRELKRKEALGPEGKRPAVLPVVLYNGESRWTAATEVGDLIGPVGPSLAPCQPSQRYLVLDERHVEDDDLPNHILVTAVVGLERSRSPADLVWVVEALRQWRWGPRDDELIGVFVDWMLRLMKRFTPHEEQELAPAWTLEEVQMTLEERVSQWPVQWMQEGFEQGLERGLEHERALLRRMAASRFGAAVAERLSGTLARIADPERLADIGEWLVRCGTGEEFLARVGSVTAEKDPREG